MLDVRNPRFEVTHMDMRTIGQSLFWDLSLRAGLVQFNHAHWDTDARGLEALDALGHELFRRRARKADETVRDVDDALLRACLNDTELQVWAAARDQAVAARCVDQVRRCVPKAKVEEGKVPVIFWSRSDNGARSVTRKLEVPTWGEIAANYESGTRAVLDPLITAFEPTHAGQLLLCHGKPGTGKSWALRALAREWAPWCSMEYVIDPEAFFGEADYMMSVLLQSDEYGEVPAEDGDEVDDLKAIYTARGRWRLLILEDTGELLAADAKERTGQALSRFLNVADGFIGQGLRVLVMVTTNEQLRDLHPAVARPGRCAAQVEFKVFPPDEAADWLARRLGPTSGWTGGKTIAELFALLEGRPAKLHRLLGFHS